MAFLIPERRPEDAVGTEEQVQLAGDSSEGFHGSLTSHLFEVLQRAGPNNASLDGLERSLKDKFGEGISVQVAAGTRGQPIFAHARARELMAQVGMKRAQDIVAELEAVVMRREQRGDYWPEGRLNLGIAYASLGKYEEARRWLDEAADMFRNPSYIAPSERAEA